MLARLTLAMVVVCGLSLLPASASANLLANPDMESGVAPAGGVQDWIAFGNVFTEGAPAPSLSPTQSAKMFGNFSGGFNVTGMFQVFPAAPGDEFCISSNAHYTSSDPMIGSQAAGGNWVVQKIVFKDAGNVEIGAVESIILDGSFAADVWHPAAAISGVAPVGTVTVEAFILYLQPALDGGAAFLDDVDFWKKTPVPVEAMSWGELKLRNQ